MTAVLKTRLEAEVDQVRDALLNWLDLLRPAYDDNVLLLALTETQRVFDLYVESAMSRDDAIYELEVTRNRARKAAERSGAWR